MSKFDRSEHARQIFFTWRTWIVVISAILGLIPFWRDELLDPAVAANYQILDFLPNWRWEWYALITVLIALVLTFEATYRVAAKRVAALKIFEEATDRTGKYQIPVKEALELIEISLAKHDPNGGESGETLQIRAANKFREVGWENRTPIWGSEFDSETQKFSGSQKMIPATFWNTSRLNVDVIKADFDKWPQTEVEKLIDDILGKAPNQYGRIKINRSAILSMFPQ